MKAICLAFLVALPLSSVQAKEGPYYILGAGASSCGSYVTAYDEYRPYAAGNGSGLLAMHAAASYLQYQSWIQGYIVGVDAVAGGHMRSIDEAGLQQWIYSYCKANPLKNVVDAANQLYFELGGTIPKKLRGDAR